MRPGTLGRVGVLVQLGRPHPGNLCAYPRGDLGLEARRGVRGTRRASAEALDGPARTHSTDPTQKEGIRSRRPSGAHCPQRLQPCRNTAHPPSGRPCGKEGVKVGDRLGPRAGLVPSEAEGRLSVCSSWTSPSWMWLAAGR